MFPAHKLQQQYKYQPQIARLNLGKGIIFPTPKQYVGRSFIPSKKPFVDLEHTTPTWSSGGRRFL